jgi:hypothetical protein
MTAGTPCAHAEGLPGKRIVCDACKRARHSARDRERDRQRRRVCPYCQTAVLTKHRRVCDACKLQHRREQRQQWLARPGNAEKMRVYRRAWTARHPGQSWAWAQARRQDPAQLARELETARMASRLWREKNGKVVRPVAAEDYAQANRHWRTPAAPVLALIDAFLAETGLPEKELAALAGVSPRLLYRLHYEHQEMLTVATADRLLLALGSHLDLVEDS